MGSALDPLSGGTHAHVHGVLNETISLPGGQIFNSNSRVRLRRRNVHHSDYTRHSDRCHTRGGRGHARRPDRSAPCAFRRKHVDHGAARWSFGAAGT